MLKAVRIGLVILSLSACTILYRLTLKVDCLVCLPQFARKPPTVEDVLSPGNGIVFLETSNRLEPQPLVACAVESAARIYPDRPVAFFMRGLVNHTIHDTNTTHKAFNLLSTIDNVFLFPLNMETLFQDTPLYSWLVKMDEEKVGREEEREPRLEGNLTVNRTGEKHWLHISADASRLAIIWKFGGMYMDSDIISIKSIPVENFLAAQHSQISSNGIFHFSSHHGFIWDCMNMFVKNYNGAVWGHQGPHLFTITLAKWCELPVFKAQEDKMCHNISFLNPQRFYPIEYPAWKRYFEVWKVNPTFNDSYALHLWNYMNKEERVVLAGSKTLVEHLYKTYCPTTYEVLIKNSTKE